jgi:hypothetical protein
MGQSTNVRRSYEITAKNEGTIVLVYLSHNKEKTDLSNSPYKVTSFKNSIKRKTFLVYFN